jgi:hypothetical protein
MENYRAVFWRGNLMQAAQSLKGIINYIHVISLKVTLRAFNFAPSKISAALRSQ